jgi:hypothetical protein
MPTKPARGRRSAPRSTSPLHAPLPSTPHVEWVTLAESKGTALFVWWNGKRVAAKSVVALTRGALQQASAAKTPVLITWAESEPLTPVIVGVLHRAVEADATLEYAKVDGRRVCLTAEDEIELRCGEASITLRRNGRLVIRGAYVETASTGTNRIKGGSVQIN